MYKLITVWPEGKEVDYFEDKRDAEASKQEFLDAGALNCQIKFITAENDDYLFIKGW